MNNIERVLSFFRSVIKSGESWTLECDEAYESAQQQLIDQNWHPISTAPKDGAILLYDKNFDCAVEAYWYEGGWVSAYDCVYPSHWMPLPPPPQGSEEKGAGNG